MAGVRRVFPIQRMRKRADEEERETFDGIARLIRQHADAARLLELVRVTAGYRTTCVGRGLGVWRGELACKQWGKATGLSVDAQCVVDAVGGAADAEQGGGDAAVRHSPTCSVRRFASEAEH